MKLVKARLRGLEKNLQTDWFTPNQRLTLVPVADPATGHRFLRLLETLNPVYDCAELAPFADFPTTITSGGYTKKIHAEKRTVAIGVFDSTSPMVSKLGQLHPALYEIDRIEIGRRLDYSRWLNFVEIASSTRLSELVSTLQPLQAELFREHPTAHATILRILEDRNPGDRVTDGCKYELARWLDNLPTTIRDSQPEVLSSLALAIQRQDRFATARRQIFTHMPLFLIIGERESSNRLFTLAEAAPDFQQEYPELLQRARLCQNGTIEQLQAASELAIAFSIHRKLSPPVLLFSCPEEITRSSSSNRLINFFQKLIPQVQCFCTTLNAKIFPSQTDISVYDHQAHN